MSEICPFCGNDIPKSLSGEIAMVASTCPSACDMAVKLNAICPSCDRVFWSRWVETPYQWQWQPRSLVASMMEEGDKDGYSHSLQDGYLWEVVDGKLHCYFDIETLKDVEIVARYDYQNSEVPGTG